MFLLFVFVHSECCCCQVLLLLYTEDSNSEHQGVAAAWDEFAAKMERKEGEGEVDDIRLVRVFQQMLENTAVWVHVAHRREFARACAGLC